MRARALLLAVLALVAACVLGGLHSAPSGAAPTDAAPAAKPGKQKAWQPHVRSARRYTKRRAGNVTFAITYRGRERGFRARRAAPLASVTKVMFLTSYLNRRGVRSRRLHRSDRRLLAPMIRRSDNAAASRINSIVGRGAMHRLARRGGMRRFQYVASPWGLTSSSAIDQARLMRRLGSLLPRRHRGYAKRLLSRVVGSQRWGVGRTPHRGWRLMFKGGWGSGTGWVDHQVALLEGRGRRISIAVFTRNNPSHGYGKRTLRGVFRRLLRGLPAPSRLS